MDGIRLQKGEFDENQLKKNRTQMREAQEKLRKIVLKNPTGGTKIKKKNTCCAAAQEIFKKYCTQNDKILRNFRPNKKIFIIRRK